MDAARASTLDEAALADQAGADVALVVDDVHVVYHVYEDRRRGLKEFVARGFKPRASRAIHAVRGVTMTARRGDAIGVVGPNGSGKSTLLQTMAGLLPVTSGSIYARSQPTLLGVGAVLKPNLSGRRNVVIGCLALGMSMKDVHERFDDIVAFAGLEEFIDVPMKAYSSGMRARLHFAIATAVTPEVLLIDEALAVGDRGFKRRCKQRLEELRERAGVLVLVSHNMADILESCNRAVWLQDGRIVTEGSPEEVVAAYERAGT